MRRKVVDLPPMPPGYNITPGTFQPVGRLDEETSEREMVLMEWGLVPYWSNMHTLIFALSAATAISFTRPPGRSSCQVGRNHLEWRPDDVF